MPRRSATAAGAAEGSSPRQRIRRAAAELYAEGGLPALSARAIARRAGVSPGLLYHYFADMSELLRTIWIGPVRELGSTLEAVAEAHPDPLERIAALLGAYADWADAHPDVHRGVMLFVRPPTPQPPERRPRDTLALYRTLRDAVAEGQATGRIVAGDPDELAQAAWAAVHGALALPVNIDTYDLSPPQRLVPATIALVVRALSAPDA